MLRARYQTGDAGNARAPAQPPSPHRLVVAATAERGPVVVLRIDHRADVYRNR